MERHFSDISNAYSWEWTITESDRSNEAVYNFNGFANDGVNGDMLFQNQPSQLKKMTFDYSLPPDAEKVRLQHWISDGPSAGISFAYTATSEAYALPAPFMRDLYFMPLPYPDFPFGYFFEDLWPLDPETSLTGNLFARTPYLAAPDVETLEGFVFGATEDPVLTTTSSSLSVALPPPAWFGRFDNTDDRVQLRGAKGILVRLFLDQTRGMKPHSDLTYELYQGDSLIGSGDLEGAGDVWGGPFSVVVPVTPGAYTMVVTYDKYHVGGQQGLATLSATFDTEAVDKNPPTLHSLRVLSPEGEPTDTVTPTGARLIELVFDEFLSGISGRRILPWKRRVAGDSSQRKRFRELQCNRRR